MNTYKVIHLSFELKSFQWGNGLYAVINDDGTEIRMCKIDSNGKPELYDDGRPMISATGSGNKGISQTCLTATF